jgi:hypothetical protein
VKKLLPLCFLVLGLGVGQAQAAAILQIDAAGLLTGATGVMVDGTAYDVSFQAGSCNTVFNGCDPTLDLFFTSGASALAASQALLDQVFIGENVGIGDPAGPGFFDSHPGLTRGCTDGAFNVCMALTPYSFTNGSSLLLVGLATNYGPFTGRTDEASLSSAGGGGVTTSGIQTFAVWSPSPVAPVPEAPSVALLGTALIVFVLPLGRRARRLARAR